MAEHSWCVTPLMPPSVNGAARSLRRFEVPFNMWCDGCGEHIGKGVRFNAEKQAVGAHHSTTVWEFSMRHHCGTRIIIRTNPQETKYDVIAGARQKVRLST